MSQTPDKHGFLTRFIHAGLAIAVIVQLLTSLVLVPLSPTEAPNAYFYVHNYSGLTAFALIVLFWIVVMTRKSGTRPGLLFPWFSGAGIRAFWQDLILHLRMLTKFRLPPMQEDSPFASAVHGLGLLLMLAMATSGTIYYFINSGNPDAGGLVGFVIFIHLSLANLVWAYLIGHSAMAVVHHYSQNLSLTEMWSFRRGVR